MIISNSIRKDLFIIIEWQHGLTTDSEIRHVRCRNSNISHDHPLLIIKSDDPYEVFFYQQGHDKESGTLKSLQYESADRKSDIVGTWDEINNQSLEKNVTCDDLFPGVSSYRNIYKQNFIFLHVNINSCRHKFAPCNPY